MCGGNLLVEPDMSVCECEYCGTKQTVPHVDDEKKLTLFTRANRLRSACEFDKAFGVYESIVASFPEEPEAYWGYELSGNKVVFRYVVSGPCGTVVPFFGGSGEGQVDKKEREIGLNQTGPLDLIRNSVVNQANCLSTGPPRDLIDAQVCELMD